MHALARHAELLAEGGEIITASAAQARALRQALGRARLAAGEAVWPTPRVLAYGAWLERAAQAIDERPALLAPGAARRLWQRIVEASPAGRQLISARAAAREAERAEALMAEWQLGPGALDPGSTDGAAFAGWVREFERECSRLGVASRSRLAALVARHPGEALEGAPRALGWHGFAPPSPAQRSLVAALAAHGSQSEALSLNPGRPTLAFADAPTPEAELGFIADWAARARARSRACSRSASPRRSARPARRMRARTRSPPGGRSRTSR